jgi:hypothetical protein
VTRRVKEILSWYGGESPGLLTHLARRLNHGALSGFGSIIGRNSFQRPREGALKFLRTIIETYSGKAK